MRYGFWAATLAVLLLVPTAAAELAADDGPEASDAPEGPAAPPPQSEEPDESGAPDDDPPSEEPNGSPLAALGSVTTPAPPPVSWNVSRGAVTVQAGNVTVTSTTVTDPARETVAPVRDLALDAANQGTAAAARTLEFLLQTLLCADGSRECPHRDRWFRSELCGAQAWLSSQTPEAVPDDGVNETFHQWVDCTFDSPAAPPSPPAEEEPQGPHPDAPMGWVPEPDGPVPVAPPSPCLAGKLEARLALRTPVLERRGESGPDPAPLDVPPAPGASCVLPEKVQEEPRPPTSLQEARPPSGSVFLSILLAEGNPLLVAAGVLAASAAGLAALAVRGTPLPVTLVVGYAKLSRRRVEEHPTREALLGLLRANPGLHMEELRRRLDLPLSTLRHHLKVLQRHGLVALAQAGSRTFAVPSEGDERGFGLRCRALGSPTAKRLLELVRLEPGLNQSALAVRLAKARSTVRWHLASLEQAGLVSARRVGGEAAYFGA